jgi:hypothetical protein
MTLYFPNVGEKEMLKDQILAQALVLFLFKNVISTDGSLIMDTLEEMPTGGGRGYAQIPLTNDLVEGAAAADKWAVAMNGDGKAEGQYSDEALEFAFNDTDVADANTVQGVGAFSWLLPFDQGSQQIRVGDIIKGATSGATGIVTKVEVQSGTWGAGTAAGNLGIMTKTGTFQDGEDILISGEAGTMATAPTAGGTGYALGDLVEITTDGSGALVVVTAHTAGVVDSVVLVTGGRGYTAGAGKATTKITGAGNDDLTVNITALAATAYAVTNTGVTADAHKKLRFVELLTTPTAITVNGQKITYVPKQTLSTAS